MEKKPEHGKRKSPDQYRKLAGLLTEGVPVGEALRSAGWSDAQSQKGWESVPDKVLHLLPPKAKRLMKLGKIDRDARRDLIRGRLMENTIKGKDGGALSAKILGSDSELNMWQPEVAAGIIVINAPMVKESALQEPPAIEEVMKP